MAHAHHHSHHHVSGGTQLRTALGLTLGLLLLEVAAGWRANSLALLSDAGHILTDVFALGLAWFATRLASRPADTRNTFGYQRSGILAALVNAVALIVIGIAVIAEAVMRLQHPQHVDARLVIPAALVAVGLNTYIAYALSGERENNLNVRAAFLHVVGDIAASVGVVVAGIAILVWKAYIVDPLLSLAIAALIAYGAWHVVRDTVTILMEGTPSDVNLGKVREAMGEVPGVLDVHDLHVWALTDGFRLLSAHVTVPEQSLGDTAPLLSDLKLLLHRRFHIEHATIEVECVDCRVPPRRPIQFLPRESSAGERRPPTR